MDSSEEIVILNNAVVCQLWEDAVSRQGKNTKHNFHSLPKIRDCEELWKEIERRESQFSIHRHNHSRSDRFRSGVRDFLKPLDRIGQATSSIASNAFPPAVAIFGAVTIIVEAANVVSDGYDKISNCFDFVKKYFEQLEVLKNNVTLTRSHLNAILEIFIHIVDFLTRAAYCIRKGRLYLYWKGLFTGEDNDLQKLKESFEPKFVHEDRVIRNETRCIVQKVDKGVTAIHEGMKRNDENIIAKKEIEECERLNKLLAWLSELDVASKHRLMLRTHQAGTGDWLLRHEKFRSWHTYEEMTMLWCSGNPGAGKSVILSMIVNFLRQTALDEAATESKVAVAYFYCDNKDPRTHSINEFLSIIIKELVRKNATVPEELDKLHQIYMDTEKAPSKTDLLNLIRSLSKSFNKVFVLIDALDELPKCEDFISTMKELRLFVRLFVTSRPNLELGSVFQNLHRIGIRRNNDSDISAYVQSEIEKSQYIGALLEEEPELETEIIKTITEKADGMFLLASYQAEYVCRSQSKSEILEKLESFTSRIGDLYSMTFDRISCLPEAGERCQAKRAISVVHHAKRPLTEQELCHVLSIKHGDISFSKRIERTNILKENLKGIVTFDENGTVRLLHLTLDEYLLNHPEKLISEPELEFAKTCLTYLNLDSFASGPCKDNETLDKRLMVYPFYQYAARHLGDHLQRVENYAEKLPLVHLLISDQNKISSLAQVLYLPSIRTSQWCKTFPDDFTSQHIAAYYGLHELLRGLCKDNTDKCPLDSNNETPLHVAVQCGHNEFARILLDLMDKERPEPYHWVDKGKILSKAAFKGDLPTLEVLLASKISHNLYITAKETVIRSAIRGGQRDALSRLLSAFDGPGMLTDIYIRSSVGEDGDSEVVQMFLEVCKGMKNEHEIREAALSCALLFGNSKAAKVLLEAGTNLPGNYSYFNQTTWFNDTFTELLLNGGADPNKKDKDDETPLHWTVRKGQMSATKILLDYGAKPNTASKNRTTPLHCAALMGHERIVNVLLDKGAEPNCEDNDGWTPLHAAALKDHSCIVDTLKKKTKHSDQILNYIGNLQKETGSPRQLIAMSKEIEILSPECMGHGTLSISKNRTTEQLESLLEAGADVDAENIYGCTRLMEAANFRDAETLALLLQRGAKVNKCSVIGQTALHTLCSRRNYDAEKEMVEILLRGGADSSLQFLGRTPLLIAAEHGKFAYVDSLVREGANVNVTDYHGRRPLHWVVHESRSCSKEALDTLQLLIDKGSDINAKDYWGTTPLMHAIKHKNCLAVDSLIRNGSEMNAITRDGCTALHIAIFSFDRELVARLLETRKCDINKEAKGNFRPLDIAVLSGQLEVVQLLQEHGAELRAKDHHCIPSTDYEEDYSDYYSKLSLKIYNDSHKLVNNLINYLSHFLLKQRKGDIEIRPIQRLQPGSYIPCDLNSTYEENDLEYEWTIQELAALSRSKEVERFVEETAAAERLNY